MKRLCLFAGFSKSGVIEDYVVYAAKELGRYADVYYYAACDIPEHELRKLDPYVKGRWAGAHDRYDFGSWQKLMFTLGWQVIEQYDSLILINDSSYGPLFSLDPVFHKMDDAGYDMWGISMNTGHIQSYFLHIDNAVVTQSFFRNFFETVSAQPTKLDICIKYEIGLSHIVSNHGFTLGCYIDTPRESLGVPSAEDITAYQNSLLRARCPFIKCKSFFDPDFARQNMTETRELLRACDYPFAYFPPQPASVEKKRANGPAQGNKEKQSPKKSLTRRIARRLFMVFYAPIKNRIVNKIDQIHEHTSRSYNEFVRLSKQLSDLTRSVRMLELKLSTHEPTVYVKPLMTDDRHGANPQNHVTHRHDA